jgi:biopolymer transport protein ExbD
LGLAGSIHKNAWLAIAAVLIAVPARAADKPAEPLTLIVEDGDVLFQGANLDLDQLTAQLIATGRQKERIYFRMGPNAKTAYTQRVVEAIKAAGFADIAVQPPPGLGKKDPEPPF